MGTIKKLSLFCFISLLSTFCFARQLCFQIVQHDSAAKELTEQSLTIEDEVLNSFFDCGYIVTNSNATISNSQNQDETLFKTGIKDAFDGFSEIFIQINLFFEQNDENTANNSELKSINYIIANASTGIKIAENTLQKIKAEHKKDDLQKISSNLVFQINKVLKNK